MRDGWLELAAGYMQRIEAQVEGPRVLPLVLIAALSFCVYFAADVMLQIYRMHPLIVFVLVGDGPPPL